MFGNLTALDAAYKNVSEGHVEAAIVGVATAVQNPMLSVNLFNMGLLSPDSVTRVFDTNGRYEQDIHKLSTSIGCFITNRVFH